MSIGFAIPEVYARGGYSSPNVSISVFVILILVAGFLI